MPPLTGLTVTLLLLVVGLATVDAKLIPSPKFERYESHPCIRTCIEGRPQNCYYDFTLEYYYTLSKACYNCPMNRTDCFRPHCIPADGVPRGVLVANRMIPGPAIQVCKGDTVVVKVDNHLTGGEGTSIHWHGIHQSGSQYMDGVSMVTQCPIPSSASFEYRFKANNSGTHFWHAHTGLQRMDGLYGAFVIRDSAVNERHLGLYEEDRPEHVIVVNDWLVEMSGERFAHHHHSDGDNKPKSMLINGKGVLQEYFDSTDNTTSFTPVEIFHVKLGRRYRFRTISSGIMYCPIQVSIDNHTLTMIASDGNPFEKIDVQSFNIFAGERYDFVLNASLPVGNYWIRVRGLADCGVKLAKQVAILRYEGAPEKDPAGNITWEEANRMGKLLNPWNEKATEDRVAVTNLTSRMKDQKPFKEIPDQKFYLAMDFNKIDNYHFHYVPYYQTKDVPKAKGHLYMPQINHISTALPPSPPLTQLDDIPEDMFCDLDNLNDTYCKTQYCECVYRLQVALGHDVEIVMIDEGVTFNANHPVHLHGNSFHVVGLDKLNASTSIEEIKRLDAEGQLHRNLTHAVAKDTVTVPDGGYSILRFHANNPGLDYSWKQIVVVLPNPSIYSLSQAVDTMFWKNTNGFWFFHCHIEFHADIGMAVIIQVGNKQDMPPVPRGFPKCGNWRFTGEETEDEDEVPYQCEDRETGGVAEKSLSVVLFLVCVLLSFCHL